jgi:hypothetical protein
MIERIYIGISCIAWWLITVHTYRHIPYLNENVFKGICFLFLIAIDILGFLIILEII